jgi:hypothetical protein
MDDDVNFDELSSRFEAKKIAMVQDKNGFVLKLSLHPNDAPEEILRDPVGQQYMIVAVRMDDQSQPVASPTQQQSILALRVAGTLAKDGRFQQWLALTGQADELSEDAAVKAIKAACGVESRTELRSNKDARDRLFGLRDEFYNHLRSQ